MENAVVSLIVGKKLIDEVNKMEEQRKKKEKEQLKLLEKLRR